MKINVNPIIVQGSIVAIKLIDLPISKYRCN